MNIKLIAVLLIGAAISFLIGYILFNLALPPYIRFILASLIGITVFSFKTTLLEKLKSTFHF